MSDYTPPEEEEVTLEESPINTTEEAAGINDLLSQVGLGSTMNPISVSIGGQETTFLPKTNRDTLKSFMDFYNALDRTNTEKAVQDKRAQIELGNLLNNKRKTLAEYDLGRRRLALESLFGQREYDLAGRRLGHEVEANEPSLLEQISAVAGTASDIWGVGGQIGGESGNVVGDALSGVWDIGSEAVGTGVDWLSSFWGN